MADDRNLNDFGLLVQAIDNSVVAAADASESMQRPSKLLAILLGSGLQAIDGVGQRLANRLVQFEPVFGSFLQEFDLKGAQGLRSSHGIRFSEVFFKRSTAIFANK